MLGQGGQCLAHEHTLSLALHVLRGQVSRLCYHLTSVAAETALNMREPSEYTFSLREDLQSLPRQNQPLLGIALKAQNLGYPRFKIQFPKHMKLKKNED